jgi:chromosome segregation ATPase
MSIIRTKQRTGTAPQPIIGATPVPRNSEEIQAEIRAAFRRLSRTSAEWLGARQERGHAAVTEVLRAWLQIDGLETERQGLVADVHRFRDQLAGTRAAIAELKKDAKAKNADEWDFGRRMHDLLRQAGDLEGRLKHSSEALETVQSALEQARAAVG